jgi:hypothetical protein
MRIASLFTHNNSEIFSLGIKKRFLSGLCLLCGLFCLTFFPRLVTAQTEEHSSGELLENYFRDNEQPNESDAQMLLETFEYLRAHPLNLNTVSKEDLSTLGFLNELEIAEFMAYRDQFGPLLNELELQAVPGWDLFDIKHTLEFARVNGGLDSRSVRLIKGLYKGENEVLMRWGRPDPVRYTGNVEGDNNAWALRFRHSFDNRLRFGFTAESDPGEAVFAKSNPHGFDFYSAHLFVQNLNRRVKALAIGDYSARFGQGLLLQTGFAPGKSAETVSVVRGGRKINAYGSFGEAYFFRGAATTLSFGRHWEVTALYSLRNRDGNVQMPDSVDQEFVETTFSSLQYSGLHRTRSEIDDEKSLKENVGGVTGSYIWKNGQVSANGLYIQYDKPWSPTIAPYRQFAFRGRSLTAFSADYNWRYHNWMLFGETARSDNGGTATVNGLLVSPDQHVTLSAIYRDYSPEYQSIYASPFAESSGAANEKGLYMGADIRWIRRVQVNVYADMWKHPWLRFGINGPSQGREYLARVLWTKSKTFSVYALWQSETKENDNNQEGGYGLLEQQRNRLRLHAIYKVAPGIELRSRVEWTTVQPKGYARAQGYIAYEEMVFKPLSVPVTGSLRYAIYETDNYDTRVFAYENDLFSAVSIPAFSGRGSRYYLNLSWRVNRWLRLESRMEQTVQTQAVTTSGKTGRETYWKLQARMRF